MELLLVLFVLFILFIVLPVLAIAGLVIVIHKPTRERVRAMFGVKKENGQIVSNKKEVDTDKNDITQDFVDFMNSNINNNKNYVFTKFEKARKGAVNVEAEMIPLFNFDEPYEVSKEDKDYINEKYGQFMIDNGYIERIAETDVNNPFAVKKLIDEMNDKAYQAMGQEVWIDSSDVVQRVFQFFKDDYQEKHSVDGIAVMVQVNKSEIFKVEHFTELKSIAEYGLNAE